MKMKTRIYAAPAVKGLKHKTHQRESEYARDERYVVGMFCV